MKTIKQRLRDNLIIGFILGVISCNILVYVLIHVIGVSVTKTPDYTRVRGNVDIEYLLEVSEDSIYIENYNTGKVYGGKYSELEYIINKDNQ